MDDALRIYDVRNPVDGLSYAMIDARLTRLRAGITGGDDANEIPPTSFFQHQGTAAVALKVKWFMLPRRYIIRQEKKMKQQNDSLFKQYAPTVTKPFT